MNTADLKKLKESLLFQKSSILNKTHDFKEENLRASSVSDESDAACIEVSKSLSIHLHEREVQVLLHIEKALHKIENGSYGNCEGCGEKIAPARLLARPFTDLCIDCMEEKESSPAFLQ